MAKEAERNIYVDNLKGLLIISVVVGHFVDIALDDSENLKSLFLFIYSFHMPLFIFINGLMCKNIVSHKERVMDKVFMFMSLYIILKAVLYFTRTVIGHEKIAFHLFKEDGVPWYLFATAAFYVISYAVRHWNKKWIFSISILVSLLVGYDPDINDVFVMSRIIVFYPFFVAGWMIDVKQLTAYMKRWKNKIIGILGILLFIVVCILWEPVIYELRPMFTGRNSYDDLDFLLINGFITRAVTYAISFMMCFCVMAIVPHIRLGMFSAIGKGTLSVFVLHRPVLYCLTYADVLSWLRDVVGWTMGNVLWLVIALMLAIILSAPCFMKMIQKLLALRNRRIRVDQ